MNPFKTKVVPRNKLINRFNISLNSKPQTEQIHKLNSSKDLDENTLRYRNHISYLEDRISQQDSQIDKLMIDIDANNNFQDKLYATIEKLKKQNKFILENLKDAQNKISDMQFEANHESLCRSIQKLQEQITTSRFKKRSKLEQSIENPQKQPFKTPRYDKKFGVDSQNTSIRQSNLFPSLKIFSQLYSLSIHPNIVQPKDQSLNTNALQSNSKQLELAFQNSKIKISKLQEAIYYLKKQLTQKAQLFEKKIVQVTIFHQKQKEKLRKQITKQYQQKISGLQKTLISKDDDIYQIQQKYANQLKEAETILTNLNQQISNIISTKDQQINKINKELISIRQNNKMLQLSKAQNSERIVKIEAKLNQKLQQISQNQKQLSKQLFIISQMKSSHKQALINKDGQIKQLSDKLMLAQRQLKHIYSRINDHKQKQESSNNNVKVIQQEYDVKIQKMKSQLSKKENHIEEQSKKYSTLSRRVTQLEQSHQNIKINQNLLNNNIKVITKQLQELQEIKESHLSQINKLNSNIRNFEGQIAQKQYLVNSMTQQMLLIKQKFEIQKVDEESQYENKQEEREIVNIEQLHEQFSAILKQKQTEYHQLQSQLQTQRSKCEQLETQIQQSSRMIQKYQVQLQKAQQQIDEYQQQISRYETLLTENKHEILELKKSISQLQEKQAFLQDYITQIKATHE